MPLHLLRHVHAGDRASWVGDDRVRPASPRGEVQAAALCERSLGEPIVAVLSSPYVRCVASVAPLAAAHDLDVEEVDELAEGAAPDVVDRLLRAQARRSRDRGGTVVLCSHGDVIGDVVLALVARGVVARDDARWPKASTWVIDGDLDQPQVHHLPPPREVP